MKILIVKTSSLGDIIHTFPVVSYLVEKFPGVTIDWVVEKPFAELVHAHPHVSRVIEVQTRQWRAAWWQRKTREQWCAFRKLLRDESYDVVFDLQGNVKSGLLTAQARSKVKVGLGWQSVAEWPNCLLTQYHVTVPPGHNIRDDYLHVVKTYFNDSALYSFRGVALEVAVDVKEKIKQIMTKLDSKKKILVCPGSRWPNKQMEITSLADFLLTVQHESPCHFLLAWGSKEEKNDVEILHSRLSNCSTVLDRLSLPGLHELMRQMDLVIAMDSLPLHLAGSAGAATFAVFGSSSALKYNPQGEKHQALQGICPYKKTFEKRCPILRTCPSGACIRSLTGAQVVSSPEWKKSSGVGAIT